MAFCGQASGTGCGVEYKNSLPRRIGLVADSHDCLETLDRGLRILQARGAEVLVHLGDICDSLRMDLLEDSVRLLRKHRILAVKGNNDFMLENLLRCQPPEIKDRFGPLVAFLGDLPMKIVWDGVCFAHSLPFDHLRSFYEPIDMGTTDRAREVFDLTRHRILFCGHSHRSVMFRLADGRVSREQLPAGQPAALDPKERYIIVTGSVLERECALFDTEAWSIERVAISYA
jgi:Calcineurin-like phosphoesterase superfamily domain